MKPNKTNKRRFNEKLFKYPELQINFSSKMSNFFRLN